MSAAEQTLLLAQEVADICRAEGVRPLLIGALALAAHGYSRRTQDVDLAIAVPPMELRRLLLGIRARNYEGDLSESTPDDPLGGVITVTRPGAGAVQIINFDNSPAGGFPALVRDALERAQSSESTIAALPTVEDLVLFKLYAGGPKSHLDILELLTRTQVDWACLKSLAGQYRMLRELGALLALAGLDDPPRP